MEGLPPDEMVHLSSECLVRNLDWIFSDFN